MAEPLVLQIDSSPARTAAGDLDRMEQAAKALEQAATAMTASFGQAMQRIGQAANEARPKVDEMGAAVERLKRQYVEGYAASQTFAKSAGEIDAAFRAGRLTLAEFTALQSGLQAQMARSGIAATDLGKAFRFTYVEQEILRSGVVNTVQSLAAGMGAARTLETQFFQTAPAFTRLGASVLGVGGAIGAVAGAMLLVGARAVEISSSTRAYETTLRALGDTAGYTGAQLRQLQSQLVQAGGQSNTEAQQNIQQILRARTLQGPIIGQIAGMAPDLATALGAPQGDAVKRLTDALQGGYPAIEKFNDALGFLNNTELANMRAMAEHGDRAGVLGLAMDRLGARVKGLHEQSLSPAGQAMERLKAAWDAMLTSLANTAPFKDTISEISHILELVARLSGGPSAADLQAKIAATQAELAEATTPDRSGQTNEAVAGQIRSRLSALQAQYSALPAGPEQGPPMPTGANDNVAQTQAQNATAKLREENDRLAAAMGKVGVERQRAVVAAGVEADALTDVNVQNDKQNVLKERLRTLDIQLAGAAAEVAAKRRLEADTTGAVVAAYQKSEVAGNRAAAAQQGIIEAITTGVPAAVRAQQLLGEASDKSFTALSRALGPLAQQAVAANRLAEAAGKGGAAEQEAAIQTDADAKTHQALIDAIATGNDARVREIELIRQSIVETERDIQAKQNEAAARRLAETQENELAMGRAELQLLSATVQERERSLALLRAEQQIRAMGNIPQDAADRIRANAVALADQKVQLDQNNAALQELQQFGTKAFDDLGSAMVKAGDGGIHFRDVIRALGVELQTLILRMALLNPLKNMLLGTNLPTLANIGGILGGGGAAPAAGGGQAMGGLGSLGSVLSGASSLFGGGSSLGTATSVPSGFVGPLMPGQTAAAPSSGFSFSGLSSLLQMGGGLGGTGGGFLDSLGGSLGFASSSNFVGPMLPGQVAPVTQGGGLFGSGFGGSSSLGSSLGGIGAGIGFGTTASGLAGAAGITKGNNTNAMIGSTIGSIAGAYFGPVGSMVGGTIGGLIGGAFGPGQSQFSSGTTLDLGNLSTTGVAGGTSAGHQANIGTLTGATGALQRQIGALTRQTGGTLGGQLGLVVDNSKLEYNIDQQGYRKFAPTDTAGFVDAIMVDLAKRLQGVSPNVSTALQHVTSASDIQGALDFVKQYDALIAQSAANASQVHAAIQNLNDSFAQAKTTAEQYGLSVDALSTAQDKALGKMRDDFDKSVQDQILGITDPLQAQLNANEDAHQQALKDAAELGANLADIDKLYALKREQILDQSNQNILKSIASMKDSLQQELDSLQYGSLSALSPGQQYTEATSAFTKLQSKIANHPGEVPANANEIINQYLSASRLNFASGPQYAANFASAQNLLTDLLGKPRMNNLGDTAAFQTVTQLQASNTTLVAILDANKALTEQVANLNTRLLAITSGMVQAGSIVPIAA